MKKLLATLMLTATISVGASGEEGGFVKSDFYKTMGKNDKASVLMVHFGTTFDDTRANTIDAVNAEAKKEFPKMEVREAYTSRIIMRRLKERGIVKDNPAEALDKLVAEGYTHLIVQPTNIINGVEAKTLEYDIQEIKGIKVFIPTYLKNLKTINIKSNFFSLFAKKMIIDIEAE